MIDEKMIELKKLFNLAGMPHLYTRLETAVMQRDLLGIAGIMTQIERDKLFTQKKSVKRTGAIGSIAEKIAAGISKPAWMK